jgi:hypothetical protein
MLISFWDARLMFPASAVEPMKLMEFPVLMLRLFLAVIVPVLVMISCVWVLYLVSPIVVFVARLLKLFPARSEERRVGKEC